MPCNRSHRLLNTKLNAVQSRFLAHFPHRCTGCTESGPFSSPVSVPLPERPAPSRSAARPCRAAKTSPGRHFLCSVPEQTKLSRGASLTLSDPQRFPGKL
jgi:hypothetical protein